MNDRQMLNLPENPGFKDRSVEGQAAPADPDAWSANSAQVLAGHATA